MTLRRSLSGSPRVRAAATGRPQISKAKHDGPRIRLPRAIHSIPRCSVTHTGYHINSQADILAYPS
jgi:hypothetical protein